MNHIFSIHSNICVIVIYDRVRKLLENNENVIIVSDRNTAFPFFQDRILFNDIQYITDKYRGSCKNIFSKFINYAFEYLPHYKKSAKKIIGNEDFILYLSSCNYFTISPYLWNKHCKGYYFIEEGTMSYMDVDELRRRYKKQLYSGQILLNLIGFRTTFDFYTDSRFGGCICVSEYAFPWCKTNKIVSDLRCYCNNEMSDYDLYDYLIVTDYLDKDIGVIFQGFEMVLNTITPLPQDKRIGVKMHPTAYSYQKEKINEIQNLISRKYSDIKVVFLPSNYVVEKMLIKKHTIVYSIFDVSSLLLYALALNSRAFVLTANHGVNMKELKTITELLEEVYKSY